MGTSIYEWLAEAQEQRDIVTAALCQIALNGEPGNRTWLAADESERDVIVSASHGSVIDWTWDRKSALEYLCAQKCPSVT